MRDTYVKIDKTIYLQIEPQDYKNFIELIENALAHLNDITIKAESDKQIYEAWREKLPQNKQYAIELLKELQK